MKYSVLSPRGNIDPIKTIALNPRVKDLNKATIGLYTTFKEHWVLVLDEIARQLQERYPGVKFTRFQYKEDLNAYTQVAELSKDKKVRPAFEKWLKQCNTVIVGNADAGSCTLYLTYNTTFVEHMGKPVVMTVANEFVNLTQRAAELRGVPALRYVRLNLIDIYMEPDLSEFTKTIIPQRVREALDDIIDALTKPLTAREKSIPAPAKNPPRIATKGTIEEINRYFYQKNWAYGMPILPPTEEAVKEMLKGTDLPPDYVVAKMPPMMGKATVEKIAVNAVMAGCLPTYMPVLIAGVEAMTDPHMWLEAYTCSVASWAPLMIINGRVRKDLNINDNTGPLSPYCKANAAIAHAMGLIIMNIAGIKSGREDMAIFGHEGRFGICFAENEEASPWEPLHVHYGFDKKDSAITVCWPNTRSLDIVPEDISAIMKNICDQIPAFGFDAGCTIIITPELAQLLHKHGFSRKDVLLYIVEYARRPATSINIRWFIGNQHRPKNVPLPLDPTRSVRKFWSDLHLPIVVAGKNNLAIAFYGGGGDHGGPITKKINLPNNWDKLVARYKDY
jgi:hypothetical protein